MLFEPLRFVHAANLCLDATLQCTIALPSDAQAKVEDATLAAFDNVVLACIDNEVDFLLLTGNSFIERDRSLRARLALRDGFELLNSRGIPVFVTPGEHDPPEAWQAIPELPGNVTVCYPTNPEPVAILRDKKVIATIANTLFFNEADEFGIKTSPNTGERRPYRIGMLHPARMDEIESTAGSITRNDDVEELQSADDSEPEETPEDAPDPEPIDDELDDGTLFSLTGDEEVGSAVRTTAGTDDDLEGESADGNGSLVRTADPTVGDVEPPEAERVLAAFLRQALVDYAVLTGQVNRRTIRLPSGVAHSPGRPQPLAPSDRSRHGATLVAVDEAGHAEVRRLATVSTRWKSFEVDLAGETDADEIHTRCRRVLDAEPREPTESIWLVNWNLVASRSVTSAFHSQDHAELFAMAIDDLRTEGEPSYVHSFRLFPFVDPDAAERDGLLAASFSRLLDELEIDHVKLEEMVHGGTQALAWNDRLRALVPELDTDLVAAHLRRYGGQWFAGVGAAEELVAAAIAEPDTNDDEVDQ